MAFRAPVRSCLSWLVAQPRGSALVSRGSPLRAGRGYAAGPRRPVQRAHEQPVSVAQVLAPRGKPVYWCERGSLPSPLLSVQADRQQRHFPRSVAKGVREMVHTLRASLQQTSLRLSGQWIQRGGLFLWSRRRRRSLPKTDHDGRPQNEGEPIGERLNPEDDEAMEAAGYEKKEIGIGNLFKVQVWRKKAGGSGGPGGDNNSKRDVCLLLSSRETWVPWTHETYMVYLPCRRSPSWPILAGGCLRCTGGKYTHLHGLMNADRQCVAG